MQIKHTLIFLILVVLTHANALAGCKYGGKEFDENYIAATITKTLCQKAGMPALACHQTLCDVMCTKQKNGEFRLQCVNSEKKVGYFENKADQNTNGAVHEIEGYGQHKKVTVVDACAFDTGTNARGQPKPVTIQGKEAYCIKYFADVKLSTDLAMLLVQNYTYYGGEHPLQLGRIKPENCVVTNNKHKPILNTSGKNNGKPKNIQNKFIRCKTESDKYVEFEFADMNNRFDLLDFNYLSKWICPAFQMQAVPSQVDVYGLCAGPNCDALSKALAGTGQYGLTTQAGFSGQPGFLRTGHQPADHDGRAV